MPAAGPAHKSLQWTFVASVLGNPGLALADTSGGNGGARPDRSAQTASIGTIPHSPVAEAPASVLRTRVSVASPG